MKTTTLALALSALLALPALSIQDEATEAREASAPTDEAVVADQLPSYPLTTCVVSGEELGSMGEPIDMVVDGRLLRLCCAGCKKPVKTDAAKLVAKVDEAVIAAQGPIYPLDTCVISGEKFDEADGPVEVVVGTRLVRTCCKMCAKKVKAEPAEPLAKVNEALIADQKKSYPITTCVVSDEPLDAMGGPIAELYGVTLVQFCCKGCKREFDSDPQTFVDKVVKARAAKRSETPEKREEG